MGTDIHMYVERKSLERIDDIGVIVRRAVLNRATTEPTWQRVGCDVWDDRNYVTFAVLADVRNRYGFAGCRTHTPVTPIAPPRGVPEDVGAWSEGASWNHSPTWLLLSEVLSYDWNREIIRTGVVPLTGLDGHHPGRVVAGDCLEQMMTEGRSRPHDWCGGIYARDITTVSRESGLAILAGSQQRAPNMKYYVQVEWHESLEDSCASFLKWARGLVRFGEADDIRLVFGFDS